MEITGSTSTTKGYKLLDDIRNTSRFDNSIIFFSIDFIILFFFVSNTTTNHVQYFYFLLFYIHPTSAIRNRKWLLVIGLMVNGYWLQSAICNPQS